MVQFLLKLIWTGARASDIRNTGNLFDGAITIFGSDNQRKNRSYCIENKVRINHNFDSDSVSDFLSRCQLDLIQKEPDVQFMAYNPNCMYEADPRILAHTVCLNDPNLMKMLDNKLSFREWAASLNLSILDYYKIKAQNILDFRQKYYPDQDVILQIPNSSGGEGTFLLRKDQQQFSLPDRWRETECILSGYLEHSIPINAHCIIFEDGFLLFPPSVQIIVLTENKLLYRGADYIEYPKLGAELDFAFRKQIHILCTALMKKGYRGVIGIDAIIANGCVWIQEVNNRFQGSTYLLNKALEIYGYPSVQQLNYDAFQRGTMPKNWKEIQSVKVEFSYLTFSADQPLYHIEYLHHKIAKKEVPEIVCIEEDGLDFSYDIEKNAFLFSAVFSTNITTVFPEENRVQLHPIFTISALSDQDIQSGKDLTALKTSLLNIGLSITKQAQQSMELQYQFDLQNCFNIDIQLPGGFLVNCPYSLKLCKLSPFELDYSSADGFKIRYYGKPLSYVTYIHRLPPPEGHTKSGVPFKEIAFFATDRLRLQNASKCCFGSYEKTACQFCEVYGTSAHFNKRDIIETIDRCFSEKPFPFRHILIGGRSNPVGLERDTIIEMCHQIRKYSPMPIYLMCLPPKRLSDIDDYIAAGIAEFGFNLELYDRKLAAKYMPGKGHIPRSQYLEALSYAADRLGHTGAVRTAFIVGLEPMHSLLEGVETVCSLGVAPILSVFRPIPNTPMENAVPPDTKWVVEALRRAEEICKHYGLSLGPQCSWCQNNTLNECLLQ